MASPSSLCTYAAVGLAIAMAYLLASTMSAGVLLVAASRRAAKSRLCYQPAAFVLMEIDSVARRLRRHITAALLFATCLGVLAALGRENGLPALPSWGQVAIAALVTVVGAFAAGKGMQLVQYRSRLRALLDADLEVAQRLVEVQLRGHRVFNAVPVGNRVIDHVIVGPLGVFAVQIILPPRSGAATVSMTRGSLIFGPDHGAFGLQPVTEAFASLTKELGRAVGHAVKVVPTLVAPGCQVAGSDDAHYLLTSEQNCVMLVGWKDAEAYLMDDEISRISQWLSTRCRPRRQLAWPFPKGAFHSSVSRPGLL